MYQLAGLKSAAAYRHTSNAPGEERTFGQNNDTGTINYLSS